MKAWQQKWRRQQREKDISLDSKKQA